MTTEEKLKEYILSQFSSIRAFCLEKNLTYSNVDSILRRGIKNATWTNVKTFCEALQISVDDLANNKVVPLPSTPQTAPCITELDSLILTAKLNIRERNNLAIDGTLLTASEQELLFDSIEIAIGIIKRKRERL